MTFKTFAEMLKIVLLGDSLMWKWDALLIVSFFVLGCCSYDIIMSEGGGGGSLHWFSAHKNNSPNSFSMQVIYQLS